MSPRKAVAEIPAETTAAQRSEYDAAVLIDQIAPHPNNLRHNAEADEELVDSIREQGLLQPLVLVPSPTVVEHYLLVAGHRRLDGLKKAGFTHAPAIIRHDLLDEADQVAAMLVENGRRADLSALEEAEGYDLLTELGWNVDKISAASGRSKSLVRERRRLTTLPDKAKAALETGQISIEDGLKLAKLPAKEQAAVVKHAGSFDFQFEIRRAEQRATAQKDVALEAKKLRDRGFAELDRPDGVGSVWGLQFEKHSCVSLSYSGAPDAITHQDSGCFAFIIGGTPQYPAIWEVCINPENHQVERAAQLAAGDGLSEEDRAARDAERAAEQEAREEARRARMVARGLRVDDILAAIKTKPNQVDPVIAELIRLALPLVAYNSPPSMIDEFFVSAGIPEEWRENPAPDVDEGWLGYVSTLSGLALYKILAAYLVHAVEDDLDYSRQWYDGASDLPRAEAYFSALESIGHETNSQDEDTLANVRRLAGEYNSDEPTGDES